MDKIAVSTADIRPCTVDKMKALFHRWEDKSWIVPPSSMVGGHPGGEVRGVFAIVEMGEGSIREVKPTQVNFGDNHRLLEQYAFGKFEEDCRETVLDGKIRW